MNGGGDQRRLSAILAADVVGYTRLMEQDTDGTVAAWKSARGNIIDPAIADHSGRVYLTACASPDCLTSFAGRQQKNRHSREGGSPEPHSLNLSSFSLSASQSAE